MPDSPIYCFISYSRRDTDVARWLEIQLESHNYPAGLVRPGLRPSDPTRLRPVSLDTSDLPTSSGNFGMTSAQRSIAPGICLFYAPAQQWRPSMWIGRSPASLVRMKDVWTTSSSLSSIRRSASHPRPRKIFPHKFSGVGIIFPRGTTL